MYLEEELLQLSALQHFVFCQRQCALIHIEQLWGENRFTAEGRVMHEAVHEEGVENRKGVRIERGIPLRSLELGLSGKADVVEFHRNAGTEGWILFPVEYKRGKPKLDDSDMVQLCAQAMCLEEMLNTAITSGAIFYGKTKHRFEVVFDEILRQKVKDFTESLHVFISKGKTPEADYSVKCNSCSLLEQCLPKVANRRFSVAGYLNEVIQGHEKIS